MLERTRTVIITRRRACKRSVVALHPCFGGLYTTQSETKAAGHVKCLRQPHLRMIWRPRKTKDRVPRKKLRRVLLEYGIEDQPVVYSGKFVRLDAGRSMVRLSAGSYQDLANCYCSLLTRRTVWRRAAANTSRAQKHIESNEARHCTNSLVALHDHCYHKAPSTNII